MNEFEFIERLRDLANSRKHSPRVRNGIGDDAAVITESANRDLLVTTDLLIEGIDFHRPTTPPRLLGHKALAVSLSDIAAMGGRPSWSFLAIGLPQDVWSGSFKEEFYEGFFALADHFGVTLAGGDISATREGIVIDSIVLGEAASGAAVKRAGARPGDQIYVTGNLGGAAAGLKLLELGARVGERAVPALARESSEQSAIQTLLLRQLQPQPRVGWGMVLGEQQLASSMIDLSDGLSSDLRHLCKESGAGAMIEAAEIPLDEDVRHLCGRRALDPLALALNGGEDFELLFTVSTENVARLPRKVDGALITRIGEITADAGSIRIREKHHEWELPPQGFEHFANEK